jgi:hypothetical protein
MPKPTGQQALVSPNSERGVTPPSRHPKIQSLLLRGACGLPLGFGLRLGFSAELALISIDRVGVQMISTIRRRARSQGETPKYLAGLLLVLVGGLVLMNRATKGAAAPARRWHVAYLGWTAECRLEKQVACAERAQEAQRQRRTCSLSSPLPWTATHALLWSCQRTKGSLARTSMTTDAVWGCGGG